MIFFSVHAFRRICFTCVVGTLPKAGGHDRELEKRLSSQRLLRIVAFC